MNIFLLALAVALLRYGYYIGWRNGHDQGIGDAADLAFRDDAAKDIREP